MLNDNAGNLPGVKAFPLCWKCESAMVRDVELKQWHCPAHPDVVQKDALTSKQAGTARLGFAVCCCSGALMVAFLYWLAS